jgi:hypothetical protein
MTQKQLVTNILDDVEKKKIKAEMRHGEFEFYRDDIVLGYVEAMNQVASTIRYNFLLAASQEDEKTPPAKEVGMVSKPELDSNPEYPMGGSK